MRTPTDPTQPTTDPGRPLRLLRLLLAVLVLAMVGAACSSSDDSGDDSVAQTDDGARVEEPADEATFAPTPEDDAAEDAEAGLAGEADVDAPAQAPVPTSPTAVTGERIIKEGTVTVEVEPGEFDTAFGQIIARAQALGGHVSGSSSSVDADGLTSGQVTIRVPVRNFEDLLTVMGEIGEIVDRNITSQDVTAEFTDLESRRRHLQAQEAFYLGLLEQAQTVNDAIAVQQQLDGVQGQIEQITGRLNLLENRSSFSTLTVRIRELGADAVEPLEEEELEGFAAYWETAKDTFVGVVGGLLVVFTFATPFLVLLALGFGVYLIVRRRGTATPAATAPPAPRPSDTAAEGHVEIDA